jgi:hypothetical protein
MAPGPKLLRSWKEAGVRGRAWLALSAALVVCALAVAHARAQGTVLASADPPKSKSETADEIVPVCKTDLRLTGSVYDARHPERSFVLVQARSNAPAGVFRAGSWLGAFQIVAIEPRGMLLRNAEGDCWLRLVGDPAARKHLPAPPPRPAKARKPPPKKKSEVVVIGHR